MTLTMQRMLSVAVIAAAFGLATAQASAAPGPQYELINRPQAMPVCYIDDGYGRGHPCDGGGDR